MAHDEGRPAGDARKRRGRDRCNSLCGRSRRRRWPSAYVASKHGIVGLVRSVAIDVAKSGIRVNALCPGMIETAMVDRLADGTPGFREALLALKPMGRLGVPSEAAEAAIWLASPAASFITGHALAVDGGYVAQ